MVDGYHRKVTDRPSSILEVRICVASIDDGGGDMALYQDHDDLLLTGLGICHLISSSTSTTT